MHIIRLPLLPNVTSGAFYDLISCYVWVGGVLTEGQTELPTINMHSKKFQMKENANLILTENIKAVIIMKGNLWTTLAGGVYMRPFCITLQEMMPM